MLPGRKQSQYAGLAGRELLLSCSKRCFCTEAVYFDPCLPKIKAGYRGQKVRKVQKYSGARNCAGCVRLGFFLQVTFPRKAERNHEFVICSYIFMKSMHTHIYILIDEGQRA